MGKLIRLSDVSVERTRPLDSVKAANERYGTAAELLWRAQEYWYELSVVRKEGERCRKYYFGDAWSDWVWVDGKRMREDDYIRSQGKVPLQYNVIRRLGRNVVGLYRDEDKMPVCVARDRQEQGLGETMSELLSYNWELNNLKGKFARSLESFLIYGVVAHRHWFGWKKDKCDVWQEPLDINRMFWDTSIEADNAEDASMIGYVHDMSSDDLLRRFAPTPRQAQQLLELYRYAADERWVQGVFTRYGFGMEERHRYEDYNFLIPYDHTKCRVIEIWTKEQKPRYHCHDWLTGECYKIEEADKAEMVDAVNAARLRQYEEAGVGGDDVPLIETEWMMDSYWYYRFLAPTGEVIQEGETPYLHKGTPFVIKLYPMINGTVRSFVADLLDIQRMINRLVTKYDWILSASAQGNLMMDAASISDKMPLEQIARNWARVGGVVLYDSKKGTLPAPHQVSANNVNIGIMELLNVQLKMIEDISSVNGALQGKPGYAGISGTAYQQQTQNSTKGLLDLLETYDEFVIENERMDVKNIQQSYDVGKVKSIAGIESEDVTTHAQKVLNADYDLSITQSTSSPTYKERANEWLMQLLQQGVINVEQLLSVGNFPFGDRLLQELQAQTGQAANMPSPEQGDLADLNAGDLPQGARGRITRREAADPPLQGDGNQGGAQGQGLLSPELRQQVEQGVNMDAVNRLYEALLRGQQGG